MADRLHLTNVAKRSAELNTDAIVRWFHCNFFETKQKQKQNFIVFKRFRNERVLASWWKIC
ncbi:MAG: hypothetical protein BHW60_05865 [Sutterella sp. 54_7]|nr:MAG: hypothetical protein BHW60_05865 [Sutterella sp. 54_7]